VELPDETAVFDLLRGVVTQARQDAKNGDEDAAQWLAELDPRGDELGQRLGVNPAMLRAHKAAQPSERERRRRDFADRIGVDYRYLPDDFDVED
jgi:hypothetical protein